MELAQEPDIQRAISTMGQLRSSGLNLSETTRAVAQGRQFARMAGTTFGELMEVGGALRLADVPIDGVDPRSGPSNRHAKLRARTRRAQRGGTLSPQLMNLVGGALGPGQPQ
jgi:hypothetical protein